jgi:hypothetical protein
MSLFLGTLGDRVPVSSEPAPARTTTVRRNEAAKRKLEVQPTEAECPNLPDADPRFPDVNDQSSWIGADDIEVREHPTMGLGVWATAPIEKGKIITEYAGEHRLLSDPNYRRNVWPKTHVIKVPTTSWAIDAYPERAALLENPGGANTRRVGGVVNSSRTEAVGPADNDTHANAERLWVRDGCRLFLVAAQNIEAGEQVLYWYGLF